jgi:hypothetical protein
MKTNSENRQFANLVPGAEITHAWRRLANSGAAQRYIGCSHDGLHEISLCDPCSRLPLVIGRGLTIEQAICAGVEEIEQKKESQP